MIGKEGQGSALDLQRAERPFDPITFKWFGGEGAIRARVTSTAGPLSSKPLKVSGSKGLSVLGGVQGQSPWPCFL
jgi:hypothetical protein